MNLSMLRNAYVGIPVMLLLLVGAAASSSAAPRSFSFTYAVGGATATGSITFEDTLLPNPGDTFFSLPNPAVLALDVTVSGATLGNGTFGLADFSGITWETGGGTLDLAAELVGQATSGSPWGTPDATGGDFNLFGIGSPRPNGTWYFTLSADAGAAEAMVLTTMLEIKSCFDVHPTPGCNDPAGCEAAVCAVDPFCCATEWDAICADEATTLCSNPVPVPAMGRGGLLALASILVVLGAGSSLYLRRR